MVNGEPITRQDLGRLCLTRWGEETIESLVNKQLITEACHARGIVISDGEIEAEIQSIASKFGMSTDQYLKMLKTERDVSAGLRRTETARGRTPESAARRQRYRRGARGSLERIRCKLSPLVQRRRDAEFERAADREGPTRRMARGAGARHAGELAIF